MFDLPFFSKLASSRRVLVSGAGGGFDVFCGLPLYFALRRSGKDVFLGNLSFSNLPWSVARRLTPDLLEVTARDEGYGSYAPEHYLAQWFAARGETVPVYCFGRTGTKPLRRAYEALVKELNVDAVVLVDGGTDSLMRGDEAGLGTPQEDMASVVAVSDLSVAQKYLACVGFGVDAFHGVCHAHVLEGVASLIRDGGYLGAISLLREMPEVQLYREACLATFARMPRDPSIVSASVLSALEGQFGDYHMTRKTEGSELFINPLMAIMWTFDLDAVARRLLYRDAIRNAETYRELSAAIEIFRDGAETKMWDPLPM